jgi:hypothetical protein
MPFRHARVARMVPPPGPRTRRNREAMRMAMHRGARGPTMLSGVAVQVDRLSKPRLHEEERLAGNSPRNLAGNLAKTWPLSLVAR